MKAFGFAGWSGSGKTTLIERVVPQFCGRGLSVSLIKHTGGGFELDRPGKDSWRHREAGCGEVMLVSEERWALLHENRGRPTPDLAACMARMSPCDLLLVEGYKAWPMPKLEVYRRANGKPPLHPRDAHIQAIARDEPLETSLPQFALEDAAGIAAFILKTVGLA